MSAEFPEDSHDESYESEGSEEYYSDENDEDDNEESWDAPGDFTGLDKTTLIRMGDGLGAIKHLKAGRPFVEAYADALGIDVPKMVETFTSATGHFPSFVLSILPPEQKALLGVEESTTETVSPLTSKKASKLLDTLADAASRYGRSHHESFFYPKRCEFEGCEALGSLMSCSGCKMVCYCTVEHQKADWSEHKGDCKVFKRNGLKAFFYRDANMLARFPLESRNDRNQCGKARFKKQGYVFPTIGCAICCSEEGILMLDFDNTILS
jgi:hypothetical protein